MVRIILVISLLLAAGGSALAEAGRSASITSAPRGEADAETAYAARLRGDLEQAGPALRSRFLYR